MQLFTRLVGFLLLIPLSMDACVYVCPLSEEVKYEMVNAVVQQVASHNSTISNSRPATFHLYTETEEGISSGTATLFDYKGEQLIFTAAHVVTETATGEGFSFIVSRIDNFPRLVELVYYDKQSDIAILRPIIRIYDIKPLKLRIAKERHLGVGTKTLYSGYPNSHGLLTIHGHIAGYTPDGNLILDTYAWSGASGSAVLDEKGRLIGILSAMDVGTGLLGMPELIPDIIIVVPVTKINFDALNKMLK